MATNRRIIFHQLWIILLTSYLMSSVAFTPSVATAPNIGIPRTSGLPSCKIYALPVVRSDYFNRDYELVCSWNHSQAYQAQFIQRSNGETIDNYLTFPDRIISRVNVSKSIHCRLFLNSNTSMAEITTPCIKEYIPSFIRVDPFIVEVDEGSSASFTCTFNHQGSPSKLSWKVHSNGNLSAIDRDGSELHPNVNFVVHKQKNGEYLLVECYFQLHGNRSMSSYGILRFIEGTTFHPTTPSVEGRTNQITDSHLFQTVTSTTNQNNITEIRPPVKITTIKLPTSSEEGQTSQDKLVTDITSVGTVKFSTDQTTSSMKRGLAVMVVMMISISISGAGIIILLSIVIVYLRMKQKRISLPRRLSEDAKTDAIELSHIPHIIHEESSELYALSVKDKRVQDQQSGDLIVKNHDESDQNIPILSSSLGIPSLHLLESIDENVYAEPDV